MEMFYILIVMANMHKCIHLSEFIKLQHLKLMDFVACKLCFSKIHFKSIWELFMTTLKYLGFPGSSAGKESACNAGDLGLIPALGRSPGDGNGYPFQYSGLESSMGSQRVRHDWVTFTFTIKIQGFFWDDRSILELDSGGGCTISEYTWNYRIVYCMMASFMLMWILSQIFQIIF